MENINNFRRISDIFLSLSEICFVCNKCEKFNGRLFPIALIKDIVFRSYIIEIGLKAILAYENKKGTCHKLDKLFNLYSLETQKALAVKSNYSLDELKSKLHDNAMIFVEWRYFYEIIETGKTLNSDDEFLNQLLDVLILYISELRLKLGLDKEYH